MRIKLNKLLCCALVVASSFSRSATYAQSFTMGQTKEDELFLYEVKSVYEFIERFNDEPRSLIRTELKKKYPEANITRGQILASLLNSKKDWSKDTAVVKEFYRNAMDAGHPAMLSFEDTNWYASAKCVFRYEKKLVEIPVIMHIKHENKGIKWMIAGLGDNNFLTDTTGVIPSHPSESRVLKYISSSSYSTNFADLYNVFNDSMKAGCFFDPYLLTTKKAERFIDLILHNKAKFQYVKVVNYHFCSLDSWVFSVDEFNRKEMNSGWLINNIKKTATPQEKIQYKKETLFIP